MSVSLAKPRHSSCLHSDYIQNPFRSDDQLANVCDDCRQESFGYVIFDGATTGASFYSLPPEQRTRSYWVSVDAPGRGAHREDRAADSSVVSDYATALAAWELTLVESARGVAA